jgi:flagellar basal body-associated protein FliL
MLEVVSEDESVTFEEVFQQDRQPNNNNNNDDNMMMLVTSDEEESSINPASSDTTTSMTSSPHKQRNKDSSSPMINHTSYPSNGTNQNKPVHPNRSKDQRSVVMTTSSSSSNQSKQPDHKIASSSNEENNTISTKSKNEIINDDTNNNIQSKNAYYEDYESTGKWGNQISRKELLFIVIIAGLVIIGVVLLLWYVLLFQNTKDSSDSSNPPSSYHNGTTTLPFHSNDTNAVGTSGSKANNTSSSSSSLGLVNDNNKVIFESNEIMYEAIRQMITHSEIVSKDIILAFLPENVNEIPQSLIHDSLRNHIENITQNNWIRTVSYLLYGDTRPKYITELKQRFVLTYLFLETMGPHWNIRTNWLSRPHICQWYGISCRTMAIDSMVSYVYETDAPTLVVGSELKPMEEGTIVQEDMIVEIDLANNLLNGTLSHIPWELLHDSVESIFLLNNMLRGKIPGSSLGTLSSLSFLYLQDNQLTGSIPSTLRPPNSSLGTFFSFP